MNVHQKVLSYMPTEIEPREERRVEHRPVTMGTMTIMRVVNNGVAFGLTPSGESVFIPSSVVRAATPEEGRTYDVALVVNTEPQKAPWMAVRINREARAADTLDPNDRGVQCALLAEKAYGLVLGGGVWTTGCLMDELVEDWTTATHQPELTAISNRLHGAHKAGLISCARVFAKADQKRASTLLWAARNSEYEDAMVYED